MRRIPVLTGALAITAMMAMSVLFTPAAVAAGTPTVTTVAASGVGPTGATLSGTVNLNGASLDTTLGLSQNCYFQYGTSAGNSGETSTVPCATSPSGSTAVPVSANVTGLTGGTTYSFQLEVVTGGVAGLGATTTGGGDVSFTTPSTSALPVVDTTTASTVSGTSAFMNGTVNPQNWPVSSCTFSYGPSGGATTTAACSNLPAGASTQPVSAPVINLSQGTTYTYTLSVVYGTGTTATATSSTSGTFITETATAATPAAVTSNAASLSASVNPEGQTISSCTFYYGTSASNLSSAPCTQAASSITGTSPLTVGATVTGLKSKTTYMDTVVLVTADGGQVIASTGSFTTPAAPTGSASKATAVTATTATLHATVNAGGATVGACAFQWGVNPLTTTGVKEAITEQCTSTPAGNGDQQVTLTLRGLAPHTRYYDRLVLTTNAGYVITNSSSFTTAAASGKPTVEITRTVIRKPGRSAQFFFSRTGSVDAKKGFQCALATVSRGKTDKLSYHACNSGKSYAELKSASYVFSVRAGGTTGWGKAVTHRFSL